MAQTFEERFWSKTAKTEDCWLWKIAERFGVSTATVSGIINKTKWAHV